MKIDAGSKDTLKTALYWLLFVMLPAGSWSYLTSEPIGNWFIDRPQYLSLILFFGWSTYEGIREAYFFSLKMVTTKYESHNEHSLFSITRLFVFAFIAIISGLPCSIACMLMFPFLHDGAYYYKRNKLDKCYPKGYFDFNNSSAFFDFTIVTRILMFIAGLSGYIIYQIYAGL